MKDDFHKEIEEIIAGSPDNFVIQNALATCYERASEHRHILCSISGGRIVM